MISCQTDRLRVTMAGACTNCVTDMFMAISVLRQHVPATFVVDCAANRGLSPWDRSELFLIALKSVAIGIHLFEITDD